MKKVIFPGTFDPIHYGHLNILKRAARMFDLVVIAVYDKPIKSLLFGPETRMQLVNEAVAGLDGIEVVGYSGLTVAFAKEVGATAIVRGLRVFSDFEFEFRMALANRRLEEGIDTVAFITDEENTFLSSSTVKEIALLGGDVSSMVPPHVNLALQEKISRTPGAVNGINSPTCADNCDYTNIIVSIRRKLWTFCTSSIDWKSCSTTANRFPCLVVSWLMRIRS